MHTRVPANALYIATLAAVAGLILLLGALFRPGLRHEEQPPPSETDIARLTRLTQRRSLDSTTAYFAALADDSAAHLVSVSGDAPTGIIWDETGTIATARLASRLPETVAVALSDGEGQATVDWAPHLPVAGLHAQMAGPPPARAVVPLNSGDWLVAVWKTSDRMRAFAPTTYLQTAPGDCGGVPTIDVLSALTLTRAMAGGGLFDMDGHLVGLIVGCGDAYKAVAPERVDALLRETESFTSRLRARYGLVLRAPDASEATYFGLADAEVSSPMVTEVWSGFAAASAGFRPGDVIVGIGGRVVTAITDLQPLVAQVVPSPMTLTVRREGATTSIELGGQPAHPGASDSSSSDSVPTGYRVADLLPGQEARAADLQPDDRVVRIGRLEARSLDAARGRLAGRRSPVFLELEHDGRRWGLLLNRGGR